MAVGDPIEAIRRHFDRQSIHYDRNPFTRWVGRSELAVLRAMIPPAPQPGITPALDFGCGTGRVTRLLLELGYSVTGYDLSPGMLIQARAALGHRPDVTFTADRQQIQAPWPLIVSLGVLDYYPDAAPLWQEWRELLTPAGLLVVTAPNASSPLAWLYALTSRLTCPAFPATARALMEKARSAGLIVTDVRGAFPRHPVLGHTLVLRLMKNDHPACLAPSAGVKSPCQGNPQCNCSASLTPRRYARTWSPLLGGKGGRGDGLSSYAPTSAMTSAVQEEER